MSGFDYGSESEKLGDSITPGVLRLKDGDELTLLIMGPVLACQDRFGNQDPQQKFLLGVFVYEKRERSAVLMSWKLKKAFDEENKRRSFKDHFVRFSRRGSKKEDTSYGVASIPGVTPQHWAEANAAPALPLGSVEATAAAITALSMKPRNGAAPVPASAGAAPALSMKPRNGAAPVPASAGAAPATGYAPGPTGYPHPGNGAPPAASFPAAGQPAGFPAAQSFPAAAPSQSVLDELRKLDGWLGAPGANVLTLSPIVKKGLMDALGKDRVLAVCARVGIVSGGAAPSLEQLRAAIREANAVLQPVAAVVAGDDEIPF